MADAADAALDLPLCSIISAPLFCIRGINFFSIHLLSKESIKSLAGGDNDAELSLRYDLMQSLAMKAKNDENIDLAREAMEICSGIARKDISYRDIRDCRRNLDELVKELE